MSSTKQFINEVLEKCVAVGWQVEKGGSHYKVTVPGRQRPLTVPCSPSDSRWQANLTALMRSAGLEEAYASVESEKREKAKKAVAAAQKKAATVTAAVPFKEPEPLATVLGKHGMQLSFEKITPADAQALLDRTERATDFNQRPVNWSTVDRYAAEMKAGTWMEYLPDGVIGIDPDGVLINGQKRMHAIIRADREVGFVVARNVPRHMFPYFDMAQRRSAADTFAIAGLPSGFEVSSAVRLAMRYEEMMRGDRDRISWASWNKNTDTNSDALGFYQRRPGLGELVQDARALQYGAKIVIASAMVFRFYAELAWPDRPDDEGRFDPLESYLVGIRDGERLTRHDPAYVVREWSKTLAQTKERVPARRETFLFVLMRYWRMHAESTKVANARITYGRTWPMPVPYHPDGDETAIKNALRG